MPFIRYARDKRGYESTYVMHAYRPGQGAQRARVLYIFRTPAHVKIGRKPLEPEVMEALEHTHPDLSFDWTNLPAERPMEPPEPRDYRRERNAHRARPQGSGQSHNARPAPPRPIAPPQPPVLDDESPLGRVVGAERAARLRARYAELTLRISRRSRTPEDRDRLMERIQRLNPEDWTDEAAVRAVVSTVEVEWESISAELPSRRRGRRGGRHRREGGAESGHGPDGRSGGPSGIIEDTGADEQGNGHDEAHFALDADDPSLSGAGGGSGDSVRAVDESNPESNPGENAADIVDPRADRLPGDD